MRATSRRSNTRPNFQSSARSILAGKSRAPFCDLRRFGRASMFFRARATVLTSFLQASTGAFRVKYVGFLRDFAKHSLQALAYFLTCDCMIPAMLRLTIFPHLSHL
jgi:hypothetical protein